MKDKVIMEQPTPAKGFRYPRRAPLTAAQLVLFSWQKNCIPDGELISFAWFLGPEERELTLYDRKLADLGAEQVSRLPILLPVWLGNPKPDSNPKPVKPQPSSGVSDMETTYRQQRLIRMISKRLLIAYPKKWMTSTFACESHLPRKKGEGGKMHILVAMQKLMPEREKRALSSLTFTFNFTEEIYAPTAIRGRAPPKRMPPGPAGKGPGRCGLCVPAGRDQSPGNCRREDGDGDLFVPLRPGRAHMY
ncbi:uncharacterized protein L3040_005114 [Drepanopeziza brunnea f. sp. 'multigermtubi']|uniref:uncharacterized protein n=1 Tax=Drepanopeziza brunnea f. sp. 'multigermtubi' TaxID=698441 RepID=UPI002384C4CD|nr:hypothetical protein L3040_005114 [Drepanopeziza brunnea f. sp. 'multigermtubi']